jgi:hypothetical protein
MIKRLFGLSLVTMLLLIGSAIAGDTLYVWFGGTFDRLGNWNETTKIKASSNNDIPVYFLNTPGAWVANAHLPLGVKDSIFDDIPQAKCSFAYFPFDAWDDASFLAVYEGAPPNRVGFHSRSFLGFSDLGGKPNPFMHFTSITQGLKFVVHTTAVPVVEKAYPGSLIEGISKTLGKSAAGDTTGGPGFPVVKHFGLPVCIR